MGKAIHEDEWLSELDRLSKLTPPSNGLLTLHEIAELTGKHPEMVRRQLRLAKKEGRLIFGRKVIENIAGQNHSVCAYRVTRKSQSK